MTTMQHKIFCVREFIKTKPQLTLLHGCALSEHSSGGIWKFMTSSFKYYADHSHTMYSSGNIDVRNWVHLFESCCTFLYHSSVYFEISQRVSSFQTSSINLVQFLSPMRAVCSVQHTLYSLNSMIISGLLYDEVCRHCALSWPCLCSLQTLNGIMHYRPNWAILCLQTPPRSTVWILEQTQMNAFNR
jgi:hypothetical protein